MYNQDTYQHKIYYGITETKFKQRYSNHIKSFRHWKHQSNTEISSELWSIENNTYTPNIAWKILRKQQRYNPNTKRYSLFLNEKPEIVRYKRHNLLNQRSEKISKCRHRNKFALALHGSKDWIKFSVAAFEQPCVRDHIFPKSDCSTSSWSQPGFGNQWFPVLVSLFSNRHAYEVTQFSQPHWLKSHI